MKSPEHNPDIMDEVRANNDRLRREIAEFFGVAVEHLPQPNTLGWHRMLGTYVYGYKKRDLPNAVEDLRHVLEGHLYKDEKPT